MSRPRRRTRHGRVARFFGLLLGLAVASGGVVVMQEPWVHPAASAALTLARLPATRGVAPALDWPTQGSAALVIPSFGVKESTNDDVVPIASLTKMMTAYVTLQRLPLVGDATGPCITINDADLATYEHMNATGQSSVKVALGEVLCERDLLNGLLVNSANNFAVLLAVMAGGSLPGFVDLMNQTAAQLGLTHTHYVEPSGYKPGSVSTALEQGEMAVDLMASPVAREIVAQTSVTLPVAGTVGTYTPFLGDDGVIGVKSGRTSQAGGCVVLAMQFERGTTPEVLYSVVLGQRGGDLLGPAGTAALALGDSARDNEVDLVYGAGVAVATVGWGHDTTPVVLTKTHSVWWWSGGRHLRVSVRLRTLRNRVRAGEVVGWLQVGTSPTHRFAVSAVRSVAAPTIWQRLR